MSRPVPSGRLSGNSLLDDDVLPGWMRGDPSPVQGNPAAAYRDAGGMRGNSLIEDAALPAWLRNQPGQPVPPASPPQPQSPAAPSIANWIGGSAANDAMPAWLDQAYNDARIPPLQASPPQAGVGRPPNGGSQNGAPPLPGTLNANALMDEAALPEWLRAQGQPPVAGAPQSPPNMAAPRMAAPHAGTLADMHTVRMPQPGRQSPQDAPRDAFGHEPEVQRFSASDLIDPDLLPGFMQGGNAGAAAPPFGAPAGPGPARGRAAEAWANHDEGQSSSRAGRGAPIPEDELPPWLAQPEPAPMQRGHPSSRREDAYDSRRVPVPRDWDDDHYGGSQFSGGYEDETGDGAKPRGEHEADRRPRGRREYGRGQHAPRDDGVDGGGRDLGRSHGGPAGGRRRERRGFFGR